MTNYFENSRIYSPIILKMYYIYFPLLLYMRSYKLRFTKALMAMLQDIVRQIGKLLIKPTNESTAYVENPHLRIVPLIAVHTKHDKHFEASHF